MEPLEILVISFCLGADACAVSIAASASGNTGNIRAVFRLAFHFGLFQALMPVIGWHAASLISPLVKRVNSFIASILLAAVGARMLASAFGEEKDHSRFRGPDPTRGWHLVALSVATSIDALAVGGSLAMIGASIWFAAALIGTVTAFMCLAGIYAGNRLHKDFSSRMEATGGIVLIILGIKILAGAL